MHPNSPISCTRNPIPIQTAPYNTHLLELHIQPIPQLYAKPTNTLPLQQYVKPAIPALKQPSVNLVDNPIKKTTPSQIWNLFIESEAEQQAPQPQHSENAAKPDDDPHNEADMDDTMAYLDDDGQPPPSSALVASSTSRTSISATLPHSPRVSSSPHLPATTTTTSYSHSSHKHKLYNFMEKTIKEKDVEIEYDMDDEVGVFMCIYIYICF